MQIDLDILFTWGAIAKVYKKNEIVFFEDETANFYYQIIEGSVKMFNSNDEGKEFTQGYFSNGQSFGEPPLFVDEVYPASAAVCEESKIVKLSKDKFLRIIDEYPQIQKSFLKIMATRILSKANTAKDIINQKPEFRVISFLNSIKNKTEGNQKELVPFTRQEIANFTGLRVETVIRVFTKLKSSQKVDIIKHKIYY